MKPDLIWTGAWQIFGPLAVQVFLVVSSAALGERFVTSALWRRVVWQACGLSLALLLIMESTDFPAVGARWLKACSQTTTAISSDSPSIAVPPAGGSPDPLWLPDDFRQKVAERMAAKQPPSLEPRSSAPASTSQNAIEPSARADRDERTVLSSSRPESVDSPALSDRESRLDSTVTAWLGLIWIAGAGLIGTRIWFGHFLSFFFRRGRRPIRDVAFQERVQSLARRLDIRRPVQLKESARLRGPIAFGLVRLKMALPGRFALDFSVPQQDAMLAHELAHLAARDPAWQCLMNLLVACLWWHPLVWWARHRWQIAAENAADEASLLVANGANELAECLVKLGGRLTQSEALGWIGVAGNGFRSALGRRVERLLNLKDRSWRPPNRRWSRLAKSLGPVALAAWAVVGTAWSSPIIFQKGEAMRTLQQTWKHSLATLALVSTMNSEPGAALAASPTEPAKPTAGPAAVAPPAAEIESPSKTDDVSTSRSEPRPVMDPRLMKRYGLVPPIGTPGKATAASTPLVRDKRKIQANLENIVLDEVTYAGIPLSEVLRHLSEVARQRDPDKLGINFLISNVPADAATAPGASPLASLPRPGDYLENLIVRFNLPLRNVRLKDVLDVITKVAGPIHYTVESYGVVFSPGPPTTAEAPPPEPEGPVFKMSPEMMRRYGLLPRAPEAPASVPRQKESARIAAKLETLVLKEVWFDTRPLSEVAKYLYEQSRELDPDKKGLNFIINPNASPMSSTPRPIVDPARERIGRTPPSEPGDLNNVTVRFNLPLRNVRLKDVLDAVTKVADKPIRYSVEDFGILFSGQPSDAATRSVAGATPDAPLAAASTAGGPPAAPPARAQRYGLTATVPPAEVLEARTFRVDTNTFVKGLESAFGIKLAVESVETPVDIQKRLIELRLAEMVLQETKRKVDVGAAPQEELEKARAEVAFLSTTNALEKVQIRLRLAEQDLQRLQRMFESGKASSLDLARARAAQELLMLDLKALESGRSPATLATRETPADLHAKLGAAGSLPSRVQATPSSRSIQQALRQLLAELGVNLDNPGKGVFYNEITGILMVRATAEDLKTVQAAIETLGGTIKAEVKRAISVLGAVEKPGVFDLPLGQEMSVVQAIATAGGFRKDANQNRIEVSRKGARSFHKFDDLKQSDATFRLEPGDVIYVPEGRL